MAQVVICWMSFVLKLLKRHLCFFGIIVIVDVFMY